MKIRELFLSILLPLGVGIIIGFIINPFMDYEELIQPKLAPPGIVFPIVWSILYILMGISAYLIKQRDKVPFIYYVQLFVNALWSIIFFVFDLRLFALIWLILLIVLVIIMIVRFYSIRKSGAILQIPYLLWCLFAAYLNFGFYILN